MTKDIYICNNCKRMYVGKKESCVCGSSTLTKTHPSNAKHAIDKLRIKSTFMNTELEIRKIGEYIQFSTTPGYQETISEMNIDDVKIVVNKLNEWIKMIEK